MKHPITAAAMLALVLPLAAQVTTPPALGPAPALTLPGVERAALPNGLTILV